MKLAKDDVVKFQLGKNVKTTLSGKVLSTNRYYAYIQVERVSGKFAKTRQRNKLCVRKSQILY